MLRKDDYVVTTTTELFEEVWRCEKLFYVAHGWLSSVARGLLKSLYKQLEQEDLLEEYEIWKVYRANYMLDD